MSDENYDPNVLDTGPPVPATLNDDSIFGSPFMFAGFSSIIWYPQSFSGHSLEERMGPVCDTIEELEGTLTDEERSESLLYHAMIFERERISSYLDKILDQFGPVGLLYDYVDESSDDLLMLMEDNGQDEVSAASIGTLRVGTDRFLAFP